MKFEIEINGFAGAKEANISIGSGQIALIVGRNEQSKSSIIKACQLLLTKHKMPAGRPQNEAGILVHEGAARATASLKFETTLHSKIWHQGKVEALGVGVDIGDVAAGITKLSSLPSKDRAAQLMQFIGAMPSSDDLADAVCDNLNWDVDNDQRYARLEKSVFGLGWDAAWSEENANGKLLKRELQNLTGQQWGATQSINWRPPGFEVKEPAPVETLNARIAAERGRLESSIEHEAVSAEQIKQLEELAATLPALEKEHKALFVTLSQSEDRLARDRTACETAQKQCQIAREVKNAADANLSALTLTLGQSEPKTHACPECGVKLMITDDQKIERATSPKKPTKADIKKREDEQIEARKKLEAAGEYLVVCNKSRSEASDWNDKLRLDIRFAEKKIQEARSALEQANAKRVQKQKQELTVSAAELRAIIANLEKEKEASAKLFKSQELVLKIKENELLQNILAVDGLRQQKLEGALADFNARLKRISDLAGWKSVRVQPDMSIWYGDREYNSGPSESGQFRADIVLQLAIAELNNSIMVLIDRADVLDPPQRDPASGALSRKGGRAELIELLIKLKQTAIVAMTVGNASDVPNLSAAGYGSTIWVENGCTVKQEVLAHA